MPVPVAVPERGSGRRLVLALPAEAVVVVLDPVLVLGPRAPALDARQLARLALRGGRVGGGSSGRQRRRAPVLPRLDGLPGGLRLAPPPPGVLPPPPARNPRPRRRPP